MRYFFPARWIAFATAVEFLPSKSAISQHSIPPETEEPPASLGRQSFESSESEVAAVPLHTSQVRFRSYHP